MKIAYFKNGSIELIEVDRVGIVEEAREDGALAGRQVHVVLDAGGHLCQMGLDVAELEHGDAQLAILRVDQTMLEHYAGQVAAHVLHLNARVPRRTGEHHDRVEIGRERILVNRAVKVAHEQTDRLVDTLTLHCVVHILQATVRTSK